MKFLVVTPPSIYQVSRTRGNSPLQDQGIMWEDKVRVSLPLWLSGPEGGQRIKKASISTTDVALQDFVEILEYFKYVPYPGYRSKQKNNLLKLIIF